MRLRLRRAAPVAPSRDASVIAGWRQPRWSGRGTTVGTLDGGARALVDPAGLVSPVGTTWSLDWWVGAEDRWHLPAEEVAVRQRLQGSAPVVETRVRVPSGDAVHRAYAARTLGGDDVIVVEIENQSTIPFAVALAVRPVTATGVGSIERLDLVGPSIEVDGEAAVVLPRSPGRLATGSAATGDAAEPVLAGGAVEPRLATPVRCPQQLANGAYLFPLAHTAILRVVLPLGTGAVGPAQVPGPGDVASGWSRQAAAGARIELPDRRLRDAVAASARHLLLADPQPEVVEGLDLLGYHDAAATALDELLDGTDHPGRLLYAIGRHWELRADATFAATVVEAVAGLVAALAASEEPTDVARGHAALPAVARLLDAAGERRAAADLRALSAVAGVEAAAPQPVLADLLRDATGTWTWAGPAGSHDPAVNAALVGLVRDLLLEEQDAVLALAPEIPPTWLGQGWEVHDLPTRHGSLSYAVRWHGDRPALLWQVDPWPERPAVTLTVPGLDPGWRTTAPRGEAMLAPVAVPEHAPRRGITMPVTIEPLHRRNA